MCFRLNRARTASRLVAIRTIIVIDFEDHYNKSKFYLEYKISDVCTLQVIFAGLEAAKEKGATSVAVPMVGAGKQRRDPVEMVHAIVKACSKFARTQVS